MLRIFKNKQHQNNETPEPTANKVAVNENDNIVCIQVFKKYSSLILAGFFFPTAGLMNRERQLLLEDNAFIFVP